MRILIGLAMAVIVALCAAYAFSPRATPPLAATRLPVDRMAFTTLARAGSTWVAGGELGHIVWSADDGKTWTEAAVEPRRYAQITQIVFVDDKVGMAVGHEGQILRSDDGGKRWKELAFDKERGEPLMSIARLPSGHWLAVGAFGSTAMLFDSDNADGVILADIAAGDGKTLTLTKATQRRGDFLHILGSEADGYLAKRKGTFVRET